jgi:TDG/mug DNA glycosylase family protein
MKDTPWRPTKAQLVRAIFKSVPDVIKKDLRLLFCGINPGLYSAATGHHFARPGNRFWPALFSGGFTPRLISPFDEDDLLQWGYGITNLVDRATVAAHELNPAELALGRQRLERKIKRFRPKLVAILGVEAYRKAFAERNAGVGLQPQQLGGVPLWLLPNPSGLNAHYRPGDLAELFADLRHACSKGPRNSEEN